MTKQHSEETRTPLKTILDYYSTIPDSSTERGRRELRSLRIKDAYLNISNKGLNDENIGNILDIINIRLRYYSSLGHLNISHNQISSKGVSVIVEKINFYQSFISGNTELFFSDNQITDIGAFIITKLLKNGYQRITLGFSNNQITDVGAVAISNIIKNYNFDNGEFQIRLDLSGNPIGTTGILAIQQLSENMKQLDILGLPEINVESEAINVDLDLEISLMNMVLENNLEIIKQELSPDVNERLEDEKSLKLQKYAHDLEREEIIELLNNDGIEATNETINMLNQMLFTINIDLLNLLEQKDILVNYLIHKPEALALLDNLHKKYILPPELKEKLDNFFNKYENITDSEKTLLYSCITEKQSYNKLIESLKTTQEDLKTEIEASIDKKIALMGQKEDIISYPIEPDNMFLHDKLFKISDAENELITRNQELLLNLQDLTNQSYEKIENSNENVILLMGNPGSGKSTMMYALSQQEMIACKNTVTGNFALEPVEHLPNIKIGNGDITETVIPNKHEIILRKKNSRDEKITLFDYPGFSDNGDIQEIANNFYMVKLFNQAKNIKFVLVIDAVDIYRANGSNFIKIIEKTLNSFTEETRDHFTNNFSIIVNKLQHNQYTVNVERAILRILEQNDESTQEISAFINKIISSRALHSVHLATDNFYLPNKNLTFKICSETSYLTDCISSMIRSNFTEEAKILGNNLFSSISDKIKSLLFSFKEIIDNPVKFFTTEQEDSILNLKLISGMLNQLLEARQENNLESFIQPIEKILLILSDFSKTELSKELITDYLNNLNQSSKNISLLQQILNYDKNEQGFIDDKYNEITKILSDFISYAKNSLNDSLKHNLESLDLIENIQDPDYYENLLIFLDMYKNSTKCKELKIKTYVELARIAEETHYMDKAEEYYKAAIQVNPYNKDSYDYIGDFYYDMKLYRKAIECYKITINLPKLANCYFNLTRNATDTEGVVSLLTEYGDYLYNMGKSGTSKEIFDLIHSISNDSKLQSYANEKKIFVDKHYDEIKSQLLYQEEMGLEYNYPDNPLEFLEHLNDEYFEYIN